MSRLAKKPIQIPSKVTVTAGEGMLSVKGPKDTLSRSVHSSISINVTPEGVVITPNNSSKLAKALTGTFAAHVNAMMQGVETPFKKVLQLNGVGYKVELKGNELVFAVGFSHPVVLKVPEGLTATVVKTTITIEGADKQKVGQFAAEVRAVKPPEPYLGKGIKYDDEVIRRKQGKKAV
ncbi:MAG TPA: 50S ribosomal protein L6 [Candidatus Paceibacterota bacterium]|jgi:large subunit ribosomal protein L6|nr:50S ribosomal protein L6 [Candidatus Paceibacterota bacterium]